MSRSIHELHPKLQPLALTFIEDCDKEGIDLLITCTYRSNAEQEQLYAQGRTAPGKIVTNAKPGQSKHNFTVDGMPASLAIDVVPLRNGKCVWDGKDPVWARVGEIGKSLGLKWGNDWKSFKECPHFELEL